MQILMLLFSVKESLPRPESLPTIMSQCSKDNPKRFLIHQVLITCGQSGDTVQSESKLLGQLRQALGPSTAVMPVEVPRDKKVPSEARETSSGKQERKFKRRTGSQQAPVEGGIAESQDSDLKSASEANGLVPVGDTNLCTDIGPLCALLEEEEEEEEEEELPARGGYENAGQSPSADLVGGHPIEAAVIPRQQMSSIKGKLGGHDSSAITSEGNDVQLAGPPPAPQSESETAAAAAEEEIDSHAKGDDINPATADITAPSDTKPDLGAGHKSVPTPSPPPAAMPLYTAIAAQLSLHKQQIVAAYGRQVFLGEEILGDDGSTLACK